MRSNFPLLAPDKKDCQTLASYLIIGPDGSFESRTATSPWADAISMQSPLAMLRRAFFQQRDWNSLLVTDITVFTSSLGRTKTSGTEMNYVLMELSPISSPSWRAMRTTTYRRSCSLPTSVISSSDSLGLNAREQRNSNTCWYLAISVERSR